MNHQLTVKNQCQSVKSVVKVSIKNNKVCKTNPIPEPHKISISSLAATTNNKKQRTMNDEKRSQTNPKRTQFWAVFEGNKAKRTQNEANILINIEELFTGSCYCKNVEIGFIFVCVMALGVNIFYPVASCVGAEKGFFANGRYALYQILLNRGVMQLTRRLLLLFTRCVVTLLTL